MQTTLLRYSNKRASLIKIHDKKEVITSKQSERTGCIPSNKIPVGLSSAKGERKKGKVFPCRNNAFLKHNIAILYRNYKP